MTKEEYLSRLEDALTAAEPEERAAAMEFYRSYLEEGGIPAESPEDAAQKILQESNPAVSAIPQPAAAVKNNSAFGWKLAVVLLTSPLWIGLVAGWFAVLVTVLLLLALFPILLAVTTIVFLFCSILYCTVYIPTGVFGIGCSFIGVGLFMLFWKPCFCAVGGLVRMHKKLLKKFACWMKGETH